MKTYQKELVQKTWAQIEPLPAETARVFYDRLFELDPPLRGLFATTDMEKQGRMLMQAVSYTVKGLDSLPSLIPVLENLGRRHVSYGVREEHYDTVGQALLWTLGQGLGGSMTPEIAAAWAEAYTLIADVMKQAAQQLAA